jgi:hypothetical protein
VISVVGMLLLLIGGIYYEEKKKQEYEHNFFLGWNHFIRKNFFGSLCLGLFLGSALLYFLPILRL